MKILLTALLATSLASIGFGQVASPTEPTPKRFGFAIAYDLCHKTALPVATYQIGTLHDLFKRPGLDIDVIGLTGADPSGSINIGMAAVKSFDLAREVKVQFGPWLRYDGAAARIGVFVGLGGSF